MDLYDLYARGSEWTLTKAPLATTRLDDPTPCDAWDVRTLMNHMVDTQRYFIGAAKGREVSPPAENPPELLGDDPLADFADVRLAALRAFAGDGVIEKTGPMLGIAFSDQLLHGWDLARATGQNEAMPEGLAASAYEIIHGAFTDEQRQGVFGPEIAVPDSASAQARLLGYTGRDPG